MDGFAVYRNYISMKSHFTNDKYDYFKYKGGTPVKFSSYEKRKDRPFFERLSKNEYYRSLLLANFVEDENFWIGSDNSEEIYKKWKARKESISYIFKKDLAGIDKKDFLVKDNICPLIIKYRRKEICPETLVFLNISTKFTKYLDGKLDEKIIWPEVKRKVVKYQIFLEKILNRNSLDNISKIIEERYR